MKIRGAFPVRWQQQPGKDGTGVTVLSQTIQYAVSTSGTAHPSSGWKTTIPTVPDGQYLWAWLRIVFSDTTKTDLYSVSRQGIDGKGIQSSVVTYSQQTTPVDPETITNWGAFPSSLTDGYWLYTKTHIVYSDEDATDSYSVSQIGTGAYYAGTAEYWAIGTSPTTPPDGAPRAGTYANGQAIRTTWSQDRQQTTAVEPYLWNFEISADSRGNRYVTDAICIGNFAKGIASIVETYAISALGTPESGRSFPSDIADADWKDEQQAVAPTDEKRYQWNRTVVSYNSGNPDYFYHVSAVKGIDGKGATYIDLDNENDSMLYDGAGVLLSGSVKSNIRLYSNGERVTNPPSFTIQEESAGIVSSISGSELTITGFAEINGAMPNSGYVIVQCVYNNVTYTARMTIKRLVGVDKFELELTPNQVSYNTTTQVASTTTINVKVWRTPQNGNRQLVSNLSAYNMKLMYGYDASSLKYSFTGSYNSGQNLTIVPTHNQYKIYLVKSDDSSLVYDSETVPINKVANGAQGSGAVVVDLDNENDSMLYDGAGNLISGNAVTNAKLLVGNEDKTSEASWNYGTYSGMESSQISIDGSTLTVTGLNANTSSGFVDVVATYGGKDYTARFTLKKLRGTDKYELVCIPSALTYNKTTQQNPQQDVNIKVYRTGQDGVRSLVRSLSAYNLKLRYYYGNGGPTFITDGQQAGYYYDGVTKSVYANMYDSYRYELLNSAGLILDSETVPIGKVSDGEGKPGPAAKSVYKNSFAKPSTPTGATPSGWTNEPVEQAEINIQPQGDWYLADDGFLTAPLIANSQSTVETLSFVTTEQNQTVNFRLKCSISSYDNVYVGSVDNVAPTVNYLRKVSGTSQDTGDLSVTVANPGAHFICVAYQRGYSGTSSYVKFICGNMFVWKSDAVTYNTDGTVATWGTPYKVSGKDAAFTTQTKTNLLLQTNFLASRMDKWDVRNGATASGVDGRNGYHGSPQIDTVYKELLKQTMYDPDGERRLLANTWYTLSFWAKADPYVQINKYETSIYYGFAQSICYFAAGVANTLTINGYCSSTALNAGEELRAFVYNEDWSWSTSVAITTTYSSQATVQFQVPSTGKYFITSYVYKSGGITPAQGKTCTLNWYRINRGMMMVTYLYPSNLNSGETQADYTCIDTGAGRIKDGEILSGSSPTDNNAVWQLTEVWTRHTLTFKTRSSIPSKVQSFLVRMAEHSHDVYVCMPKIEQGTTATDYCTNDSDVADLSADTLGYPRETGIYNDETVYKWNEDFRDFMDYEFDGTWYRFGVKRKGMIIPAGTPPTTSAGDDNWEVAHRIQTLITDTVFGANANIGGFMATESRLLSRNGSLFLDGLNGLIRLLHSDGYKWEVMTDGTQYLGVEGGRRIEIDPSQQNEIRIFDDNGNCVSHFSGDTFSSLDSLFGESTGEVTLNSNKSGSSSASNAGSKVIDNRSEGTRNIGYFSSQSPIRIYVNGTVSVNGTKTTNGTNNFYNYAIFRVGVKIYSDENRTRQVKNRIVAETASYGDGPKNSNYNNVAIDLDAGYYTMYVEYSLIVFANQSQTTSCTASWNITSASYRSDIYLSRLFANGAAYGSSINNFFAAMNVNSRMLVKASTLASNGKQNGFELSSTGLSIVHAEKLIRPMVTLGFGVVSGNGTLSQFTNSVRGSEQQPQVNRITDGVFRITYPSDWTALGLSQNNLYVEAHGMYKGNNTNTTVSVYFVYNNMCQIVIGDDMSPNDGFSFFFEIKYLLP